MECPCRQEHQLDTREQKAAQEQVSPPVYLPVLHLDVSCPPVAKGREGEGGSQETESPVGRSDPAPQQTAQYLAGVPTTGCLAAHTHHHTAKCRYLGVSEFAMCQRGGPWTCSDTTTRRDETNGEAW